MDISLAERRLGNGMRVVVNPDPGAPGVAVNIWYAVGSGDERPGATGFAHLFEHLMFSGSAHVADGEHLSLLESIGATANATTSFDRTNYYETVPAHALELALWLEADRLESLAVTQEALDVQREVVKEEKRQSYDNVPYGDQLELLLGLAFPPDHPYAHPTIGSMADLDAASLGQVRQFFADWYRPRNASLVVCGPVTPEQVFDLVERHFGPLPDSPGRSPEATDPLPPIEGTPRATVFRTVPQPVLQMVWRTPPLGDPDCEAVEVALDVLGAGQACRLHRDMVRGDGIADVVGGGDYGLSRGVSLAGMGARPRQGHVLEELEAAIVAGIEELGRGGPTEAELSRVMAGVEREWFQALATVDSRADEINELVSLLGEAELVNNRLERYKAVTAADVARVCQTWLAPEHRAVLDYEVAP